MTTATPTPADRRPLTAAEFNARYPVGTPVVAYPGARPEDFPDDTRIVTRTRSRAEVLGGHTDVVWVNGHSACIALSHIDVDEARLAGLLAEQTHQYRDLDADSACCLAGFSCPACPPRAPKRVQRKRTKGWRKPEGAVYVGRGSRWGNVYPLIDTQVRYPAIDGSAWELEGRIGKASGQTHHFKHPDGSVTWHRVEDATPEQVVELYRRWLAERPEWTEAAHRELSGRDLMCWCPLDQSCHADVLLDLANGAAS